MQLTEGYHCLKPMAAKLLFEQWVPHSKAIVFRFFSDLQNLPRLMPSERQTQVGHLSLIPAPSGEPAGPGSEFTVSFRPLPPLPFRAQWTARIVALGHESFFEDIQSQGPFRHWRHRHEFASETREGIDGTLVRDRIEIDLGWSVAGWIAGRLLVIPELRRTFAERQNLLSRILAEIPEQA